MRELFRKFDYFGVHFNFLFNSQNTFTSATGGFVFAIFLFVSVSFILISAFDFIFRKNYSVVYYTLQVSQPDIINLHNYTSSIAFGVDCDIADIPVYDLFSLKYSHVSVNKEKGVVTKSKDTIKLHRCLKEDFYNEFDDEFSQIGLDQFYCVSNTSSIFTTQGIYADEVFTYFELTVSAKEDDPHIYEEISKSLTNGECHMTYYFIDVAIQLDDFKYPVRRFLNTHFVPLQPDEYVKINLFFEVKEFNSYENILIDSASPEYYVGYGSQEVYSTYKDKGAERLNTQYNDYEKFGKIFIRSALSRTYIQRKYLKLTEFAADTACLLNQLLMVLFTLMTRINRFYGNNSIMTKLFTFKECDKEKHNVYLREYNKYFKDSNLYQHFSSTNLVDYLFVNDNEPHNIHINNSHVHNKNNNILIECEKDCSQQKLTSLNNSSVCKKKQTHVHSNKNLAVLNNCLNHSNSLMGLKTISNKFLSPNNINTNTNNNINININTSYQNETEFKSMTNKKKNYFPYTMPPNEKGNSISKYNINKQFKSTEVNYTFAEMLVNYFCPRKGNEVIKMKNALFKKARAKFYNEMDVVTYLKNTHKLDIMNYLLLTHQENILLQFVSKPIISLDDRINISDQLKMKYNFEHQLDKEAIEVCKIIKMLCNKKEKNIKEKKLMNISCIELCHLLDDK